jgi:hypothetical protein
MGNTHTGKALNRPIIKQIHVGLQHIKKRIQGMHFQFMKLTKTRWNQAKTIGIGQNDETD